LQRKGRFGSILGGTLLAKLGHLNLAILFAEFFELCRSVADVAARVDSVVKAYSVLPGNLLHSISGGAAVWLGYCWRVGVEPEPLDFVRQKISCNRKSGDRT
jgi:hypothetical protein